MFVRMTPLAACNDPRALHPVTPIDNEGCAWFAMLAPFKPVDPDTVGNPDKRDHAAREAEGYRSGGMRTYASGAYIVATQAESGNRLAHSAPWYERQNVAIGTCYDCINAIRFACNA